MSWALINAIAAQIGVTFGFILPYLIPAVALLSILSARFPCNQAPPWWRSPELATNLCYWLLVPIFTRAARIGLLVASAALLFGATGEQQLIAFYAQGHGPLAALPFWCQVLLYLVLSDLLLYVIHRLFHATRLWRYHAIHHSSRELDWSSAARFHPVNLLLGTVPVDIVLLLGGLPPTVLTILLPFDAVMAAFVHSNLNWTLGPLGYVIATPVFHRWHHANPAKGANRNFARTFALLDVIFGTFSMPKNASPGGYGAGDLAVPPDFGAQLVFPFGAEARARTQ
jgi:sterol desaturase/sphingolipid hydroxylase (fatty acid hydroxylase superfamily)